MDVKELLKLVEEVNAAEDAHVQPIIHTTTSNTAPLLGASTTFRIPTKNASGYVGPPEFLSRETVLEKMMKETPVQPYPWVDIPYISTPQKMQERIDETGSFLFPGSVPPKDALRHLAHVLAISMREEGEAPATRPCRFLMEAVRDSEISGIPAGVRQRCTHPLFALKRIEYLVSTYAEILNSTEYLCERLAFADPAVFKALPAFRRVAMTERKKNHTEDGVDIREAVAAFYMELDHLRARVAECLEAFETTHVTRTSDERFFTNEPKE